MHIPKTINDIIPYELASYDPRRGRLNKWEARQIRKRLRKIDSLLTGVRSGTGLRDRKA